MTSASDGAGKDQFDLIEECRRELDVVRAAAGHLDLVVDRIDGQLAGSHRLGVATGIVMAQHQVHEVEAARLLQRASHSLAVSLGHLVDTVIATRSLAPVPDYI